MSIYDSETPYKFHTALLLYQYVPVDATQALNKFFLNFFCYVLGLEGWGLHTHVPQEKCGGRKTAGVSPLHRTWVMRLDSKLLDQLLTRAGFINRNLC